MKTNNNFECKGYNLKKAIYWFSKQHNIVLLPFVILRITLCFILSRLLHFFVTKDEDKIVVACSSIYYNGNSRAIFEWMRSHPERYDCYWEAKNLRSLLDVKNDGGKAFLMYGLMGLPYFLKTDAWIRTHSPFGTFSVLPNENYEVIMTWHGIGYKGHRHNRDQSDYDSLSAWCTSSEWVKKRHVKLWQAPEDKIFVTGYANLDRLIRFLNKDIRREVCAEWNISAKRKNILYAPTWTTPLWAWGNRYDGFKRFCEFCQNKNTNLIVRLHPYARVKKNKVKRIVEKYPSVILLNMKDEPDTMKILSVTDILITDWSSIATDFLLLKRPIIFIDRNQKKVANKERGEGVVPPSIRPGEKVATEQEFFSSLAVCFNHNRFEQEQEQMLLKLHGQVDGNASARVAEVIEKLVKTGI